MLVVSESWVAAGFFPCFLNVRKKQKIFRDEMESNDLAVYEMCFRLVLKVHTWHPYAAIKFQVDQD